MQRLSVILIDIRNESTSSIYEWLVDSSEGVQEGEIRRGISRIDKMIEFTETPLLTRMNSNFTVLYQSLKELQNLSEISSIIISISEGDVLESFLIETIKYYYKLFMSLFIEDSIIILSEGNRDEEKFDKLRMKLGLRFSHVFFFDEGDDIQQDLIKCVKRMNPIHFLWNKPIPLPPLIEKMRLDKLSEFDARMNFNQHLSKEAILSLQIYRHYCYIMIKCVNREREIAFYGQEYDEKNEQKMNYIRDIIERARDNHRLIHQYAPLFITQSILSVKLFRIHEISLYSNYFIDS